MHVRKIELLAPARDLACGKAAINHGADAVYIGGPLFGARAAAGNSLADIEQLVACAHQFRAKVYVALNTLLEDHEFDQAVTLCRQLYELGADALIIQDVGLLEADLPPIPLHASTQMNNRTPDKVRFLEQVGFAQVVLARELGLGEIQKIRAATTVELEFFVHGALCVAYSGQCYISEVMAGRSANRGRCAQFCRHRFDLLDGQGRVVEQGRSLLSLKDLDLSAHLTALIDAGIDSFKIEGRLKDENYVKNVTAAYRLALDALIEGRGDLARGSAGRCRFGFTPDPARSFHRGATEYCLLGRSSGMAEVRTPKSMGKEIGRVAAVSARSFTLDCDDPVANGDGLCFFDRSGALVGLRVNRAEGRVIYPKDGAAQLGLTVGTLIHRNLDVGFNRLLAASTLCRRLEVELRLAETAAGLELAVRDEEGVVSTTAVETAKETAHKAGAIASVALRQLRKSGETVFAVGRVELALSEGLFVPAAVFNALRRQAFARHLQVRLESYRRQERPRLPNEVPWIAPEVDYRDNIANRWAAAFYRRHGVARIDPAMLRAGGQKGCALMTTRYCLRAELHLCPRRNGQGAGEAEPLILVDNTGRYRVRFDCGRCEMTVTREEE